MRYKILVLTFLTFSFLFCSKTTYADGVWTKTNPASTNISTIETTPWGIMAGEYDTRLWLNPYNGVHISSDLGNSWTKIGLNGRGITDISYLNQKLYVSTYYSVTGENGFFKSADGGKTWKHYGNNFSASSVLATKNSVVLGTFSHGLWISKDEGVTWIQKIGDGYFGPQITEISGYDNTVIASTSLQTFISTDYGDTWVEILQLKNLKIKYIEVYRNVILVGNSNSTGLYRSTDFGKAWEKVANWGNSPTGAIKYYNGVFYAGKQNPINLKFTIYKSLDFGLTWEDTLLNLPFTDGNVLDIAWIFSSPSFIFTATPSDGIYKYTIPKKGTNVTPFLKIPWEIKSDNEFIEKIYTFFDHEYPLLGYPYFTEPSSTRNTTLNYLGIREKEPKMYYSSHDGYDFSLSYGTKIIAPAPGYATYGYDKTGLGNYIKIDHLNGYQTTYAHLQKNGLFTTTDRVWVDTGNQIGLVGMTGNTTGPHLHFSIAKTENPNIKTDPFGWDSQNINQLEDPWKSFKWTDAFGDHSGTPSEYLWEIPKKDFASYLNRNTKEVVLESKKITFPNNSEIGNSTIFIQLNSAPKLPNILTYIPNTSFMVNVYSTLGEKLNINLPTTIEIDLTLSELKNIKFETLKIYYLDELTDTWKALESTLDLSLNKISAITTHFSDFTVMGEKIDSQAPKTQISINGNQVNGWFKELPLATLSSADTDLDKIFYSINDEEDWNEYTTPFTINLEGIVSLQYKAQDLNGNQEEIKDILIKIDTKNKFKNTVTIKAVGFSTE